MHFLEKKLSHQDHPQHLFLECKSPVLELEHLELGYALIYSQGQPT